MASPPEAHNRNANDVRGAVYGQLLQVRDIHGGVTVNAAQAPPPVADVSLDPPRPATPVRGRAELLGTLHESMERGAPVPHVLTGPGGFGKTTVAAALAERARARGWTVFWVRPDAIVPSMLEVAVELGGSRQEAEQFKTAPRSAARWVWRHLDTAPRPWLLVIDNADQPELLDPENRPGEQRGWMRSSPGGFVLVTSRVDDPALWAPADVHRVGVLGGEDAATALADHAGLTDLPGGTGLAERLGGVPLALSLAGRILATHGILFPDADSLLERIDGDISELDQLAAPVTGTDGDERQQLSGVWDLSLRLVARKEPMSAPLLRILSVLGSNAVAVPLRRLPLPELADGTLSDLDEVRLVRAINALVVHGLVTVGRRTGETSLRLHPLVSESIRASLGRDSLPLLETAERLLRWRADRDSVLETGAYTVLHDVLSRIHGPGHPDSVRVNTRAQRALMISGLQEEAERNLRVIVDQSRDDLGEDHPESLRAQPALGDALRGLDRFEEAEEIFRTVLGKRRSVLGPTHPETLSSRHQVALMRGLRGDLATAEAEFRALWEEHPEPSREEDQGALQALENLSFVLMYKGEHDAAEEGFRRVGRARSRLLGRLHPRTVETGFNLARVAFERGDHRTAAEGFARTLETCEELLGEDHPLTSMTREWFEKARRLAEG
ncbi:tetratricopeptide repeat protein [Nocardiopsis metallicus]|uniref:Tetratricopeptide (TPR) repeat protein n=1 Tax=Nocardiopsis metallicus TaxID=179819 RepID=A0A840W999_9ACTN|nr:tetratricopeptide repeat protein [Nocardiopsis metallicus]MBB5492662.1 tetratricopeptide (TPR) repeat protein [Nocardiopsis metallicus]